jgi:23S rRNA pseudoU1915 N3-methylase RlmH
MMRVRVSATRLHGTSEDLNVRQEHGISRNVNLRTLEDLKIPNKQLKSKKLAKSLESLSSDGRQAKGGGSGVEHSSPQRQIRFKICIG